MLINDEEVDTRIVLHAQYARGNDSVMERVISIPGELLIQDPEAPVCEMYRSKWHTVDVLATRSTPSL